MSNATTPRPARRRRPAATVLALREQQGGDAGHYGVGSDAGSAIPDAS